VEQYGNNYLEDEQKHTEINSMISVCLVCCP